MSNLLTTYTPIEQLLIFQALRHDGQLTNPQPSFDSISTQLKQIPAVHNDSSYDPTRLAPAALAHFYQDLLKNEVRRDVEKQGSENSDALPVSRKRKAPSPKLPTIQVAMYRQDAEQIMTRLYARFREDMLEKIREQERIYDNAVQELAKIKAGKLDETPRPTEPISTQTSPKMSLQNLIEPENHEPKPVASKNKRLSQARIDAVINHDPPAYDQQSAHRRTPSGTQLPPFSDIYNNMPQKAPLNGYAYQPAPPYSHTHHGSPQLHNSNRSAASPRPILPPPSAISPVRPSSNSPALTTPTSYHSPQQYHPQMHIQPTNGNHQAQNSQLPALMINSAARSQLKPLREQQQQQQQQQPRASRTSLPTVQTQQQYQLHHAHAAPYIPPQYPVAQHQSPPTYHQQQQAQNTQQTYAYQHVPAPQQYQQKQAVLAPLPSRAKRADTSKCPPTKKPASRYSDVFSRSIDEIPSGEIPRSPRRPSFESLTPSSSRSPSPVAAPPAKSTRGRRKQKKEDEASSVAGDSIRQARSMSVASTTEGMQTRQRIKAEPSTSFIADSEEPEPEPEPAPSMVTRKRRGTLQSAPSAQTRRKRQYSYDNNEDGASAARPATVLATKNLARTSNYLIDEILRHKHAAHFKLPVLDKVVDSYSKFVKRPQDLKSIRTAITQGGRAVAAALANTAEASPVPTTPGDASKASDTVVELERTLDLIPPKAIINSSQLEREIFRMFANAVMFNPGEDGIVADARDISGSAEAMIANWREAKRDIGGGVVAVEEEDEARVKRRKL